MKKILYVDPTSYEGHKGFNFGNLRILQNKYEISTLFRQNYLNNEKFNIRTQYEMDEKYFRDFIPHRSKVQYFFQAYFSQIKVIRKALKIARKDNVDYIFFSTIDIVPFVLATSFASNKITRKISFVDHGLYFSVLHKPIHIFWKFLNKKITIVLLEEYWQDCLEKYFNIKKGSQVVNLSIRNDISYGKEKTNSEKDKNISIFSPSVGNDETFIKELLKKDEKLNGVNIFIRGKDSFNGKCVEVYNTRLSNESYNKNIANCDYILIPYGKDYIYRTSAVLFEAIVARKKVLILGGNTLSYYSDKYPAVIKTFTAVENMIEVINDWENEDKGLVEKQINQFLLDYSDEKIEKQFAQLFSDDL